MKDKNKLIIISTLIVMVCLLSLYSAYKYYNKTPNKIISNVPNTIIDNSKSDNSIDKENNVIQNEITSADNEEINVGDYCIKTCTNGSLNNPVNSTKCCQEVTYGNNTQDLCTSHRYTWKNNKCWTCYNPTERCVTCQISRYNVSQFPQTKSVGGSYTVGVSTKNCAGSTITATNGSTTKSQRVTSDGIVSFTFNASQECGYDNVSITASNGDTVNYGNIRIAKVWTRGQDGIYKSDLPQGIINADNAGVDIYGTCDPEDDGNGDIVYNCKNVHQRGCGKTNPPTPTPTYDFCCMTDRYLGISSDVIYKKYQTKRECPEPYKYLDENISENKCHKYEVPGYCSSSSTGTETPRNASTKICEDTVTVATSSKGQICKNNQESFYTINCTKEASVKFDYGNDSDTNTKRELYKGQGFGYGIGITTKTKCTAEFNGNAWNTVYNKFIDKINAVSSTLANDCKNDDETSFKTHAEQLSYGDSGTRSKIFELWTIISDIRDIVRSYNKFRPQLDYNESTNLSITYKNKGETNKTTDNHEFDKEVSEGKFTFNKKSEANLNDNIFIKNCYGNTIDTINENCRPVNYELSNYSNPRVVKMNPKKVSLDSHTGEITNKIGDNLDGGNNIYTNYQIDVGTWSMNITVSGLIANSSVTNDKCDIKVKEQDIEYRPIDVTNPFINSKWEKGINWLNSKYDFTRTISAKTWSERALNKVDLPSSRIVEIKQNNEAYRKSNYSPYLGVCDVIKGTNSDYVCKVIK